MENDKKCKKSCKNCLLTRMIIGLLIMAAIAFSPRLVLLSVAFLWAIYTQYPNVFWEGYLVAMLIAVLIKMLLKRRKSHA